MELHGIYKKKKATYTFKRNVYIRKGSILSLVDVFYLINDLPVAVLSLISSSFINVADVICSRSNPLFD